MAFEEPQKETDMKKKPLNLPSCDNLVNSSLGKAMSQNVLLKQSINFKKKIVCVLMASIHSTKYVLKTSKGVEEKSSRHPLSVRN